MKLKSVTIEGMHRVQRKTYHFNNLNYLHGDNGAGKSTVLQAVQLALLGYIPGTNKTKEAIFRHSNNHTMAVTAVLDDNGNQVEVRRVWAGNPPKTVSTVEVNPKAYDIKSIASDIELPIFNFNEFVGMTANKLKDWFISFLPKVSSDVDWENVLKDAVKDLNISEIELLPDILEYINTLELKGVEAVRNVNQYLKSLLSAKKSELDRTQHTIQSLIFYDDEDLTDITCKDLSVKLSDLNEQKQELLLNAQIKQQRSYIEKQIANLSMNDVDCVENDPQYIEAHNKHSEAKANLVAISDELAELTNERSNLLAIRDTRNKVINGKGICPFTSTECASIKSVIDQYTEEVANISARLVDIADKIEILIEKRKYNTTCLDESATLMKCIESNYSEFHTLKSQLDSLSPVIDSNIDVEFIDSEIKSLSDRLIKLNANDRYNNLITELTKQKYIIEQSIIALKAWISLTDANGLQTTMMEAPFGAFASELDEYIPVLFSSADISAKFHLPTKANSFTFGLSRNDKYIPFDLLSSGEKCLYTLALMMCIIKHSKSLLKVIMIDDMLDHLDDTNISKLFESLNDVKDIQFVFAGVKPCISNNAENIVIEVN